jgi:hypothetical protein
MAHTKSKNAAQTKRTLPKEAKGSPIFRQSIERVEHFNSYQHREGQCHSFHFTSSEVVAWVGIKRDDSRTSGEGSSSEVIPRGALTPVGKLGVSDKSMSIAAEVNSHEGTMCIPYNEDTNSS